MKQIIFAFFLFMTIITLSKSSLEENNDDVDDVEAVKMLSHALSLSEAEVESCIIESDVKDEDFDNSTLEHLLTNNVEAEKEIENILVKVGCLFTCLLEKKEVISDTHVDEEKVKEIFNSIAVSEDTDVAEWELIRDRILNTCYDRVKDTTDKCEKTLRFGLCVIKEMIMLAAAEESKESESHHEH